MILRQRFASPLALALALAAPGARGDTVVNFNDLSYPNTSYYDPNQIYPVGPAPGATGGSYQDGWNLNGSFTSNGASFSNTYYGGGAFSGWAYSNVNDPTTTEGPGFDRDTDVDHQFAAVTGSAPGSVGNYGIEYGTGGAINLPSGTSPVSFEVTNTTYTYLAMKYGDSFSTAFTAGSYFMLEIFGWSGLNGGGNQVGNEIDFYLANFTSGNSLLVDAWTLVNLSTLAGAKSLTFDYASSDVGNFGINTPEFFAMDNLVLSTSVPEPSSAILALAGLGTTGLAVAHRHRRRRTTR